MEVTNPFLVAVVAGGFSVIAALIAFYGNRRVSILGQESSQRIANENRQREIEQRQRDIIADNLKIQLDNWQVYAKQLISELASGRERIDSLDEHLRKCQDEYDKAKREIAGLEYRISILERKLEK